MWQPILTDGYTDVGISAHYAFRYSTYGYFGFWHILTIFAMFSVLAIVAVLTWRKRHLERIALGICAITVVACMLFTVFWAVFTHEYNLEWFIPIHICNLFGIILPVAFFNRRAKAFFLNFFVWFGIAGGLAANLSPVTTMVSIGVFHPVSIAVWVHHTAIAALGVFYIASGYYHRKLNTLPIIGILSVLIGLSAIVNHFTGANFLFINPNRNGQPMDTIRIIFGPHGMWPFIAIVFVTLAIIHFSYKWFDKRRHLTLKQFAMQNWFVRRITSSEKIMSVIDSIKQKISGGAKNINQKITSKTLRRIIDVSERFVLCVKQSGLLQKLADSQIGTLTSPKHLTTILSESGLLSSLQNEFSLKELDMLKRMPLEKTLALAVAY